MIRATELQQDAISRTSFIPYIEFSNMVSHTIDATVSIDVTIFKLRSKVITKTIEEEVTTEGQEPYIQFVPKQFNKPYFEVYQKRKAVYKANIFFNVLGNPKPSEYDAAGISQITFNNSLPNNEANYFWNLDQSTMEIVTEEIMAEILAETEVTE